MLHSCHGLEPHPVVLRPDLDDADALEKLNRTGSPRIWKILWIACRHKRDQNLTLHAIFKMYCTQTGLCVWMLAFTCRVVASACFPCICVCVCIWEREGKEGPSYYRYNGVCEFCASQAKSPRVFLFLLKAEFHRNNVKIHIFWFVLLMRGLNINWIYTIIFDVFVIELYSIMTI